MSGAFTQKTRVAVLERDGYRCVGCGRNAPLTLQHRKSRGMGGTRDLTVRLPSNALTLCGSGTTGCHGWTEANPTDAAFLGWRVPQHDDPAETPCWINTPDGGYWALLGEDTTWAFCWTHPDSDHARNLTGHLRRAS